MSILKIDNNGSRWSGPKFNPPLYLKLLLMEVVNIKRQEKASLIFHVSTHALAGPLESLQAVICNLYYASSPEKKVSTLRYQKIFFSDHTHFTGRHTRIFTWMSSIVILLDMSNVSSYLLIGYYGYGYYFKAIKNFYC